MKKLSLLNFIFLLAFAITLLASVWQGKRAYLKYDIALAMNPEQAATVHRFVDTVTSETFQPHFQRVTVEGRFLHNRDIVLIDKYYQRRAGVHVISPFLVDSTDQILLVHRGWLAENQFVRLSSNQQAESAIQLTGIIDKIRSNPFILGRHEMAIKTWPARQLQCHPEAISAALASPVYPFLLRLTEPDALIFTRTWKPVNLPWQRHLGYTVQWALLSLASLVMLWIVNRKRKHEKNSVEPCPDIAA